MQTIRKVYNRLTYEERIKIEEGLNRYQSIHTIAAQINRSVNAIYLEVQKFSLNGIYSAKRAHLIARLIPKKGKLKESYQERIKELRNMPVDLLPDPLKMEKDEPDMFPEHDKEESDEKQEFMSRKELINYFWRLNNRIKVLEEIVKKLQNNKQNEEI